PARERRDRAHLAAAGRDHRRPAGRRPRDSCRHVGMARRKRTAHPLMGDKSMAANTPLIELKDLRRVYRTEALETHALGGIDLTIERGEYVTIEGPSGCGKSTLLTVLGLLDEPTAGDYLLAGVPVRDIDAEERARLRNREIGFIFQSFNLIPEMTVAENVGLPLTYRKGVTTAERKSAVAKALDRVNMGHRAEHFPAQLSGGQQQRVAVARALVGNPSLILADEP